MRCYTYRVPLHPSALALSERTGIILETDDGWGEAAPLPGFSKDPLDSLVFALRSAMQPFPKQYPNVKLNAFPSTLEEAEMAIRNGFQTLKFKLKGLSPEAAARRVSTLQSMGAKLRLDANRCWSVEEAKRFFGALDSRGIEYIEEPIQEPTRLAELQGFPFALDETLLDGDSENIAALPQVHAFVLKPTLLGDRLDRWISFGKKWGKTLVFGTSFESAIGLTQIARLQEIHAPMTPAGLDTFRFFKQNFLPFPIEGGTLQPHPIPPVDRACLMKIAL